MAVYKNIQPFFNLYIHLLFLEFPVHFQKTLLLTLDQNDILTLLLFV